MAQWAPAVFVLLDDDDDDDGGGGGGGDDDDISRKTAVRELHGGRRTNKPLDVVVKCINISCKECEM